MPCTICSNQLRGMALNKRLKYLFAALLIFGCTSEQNHDALAADDAKKQVEEQVSEEKAQPQTAESPPSFKMLADDLEFPKSLDYEGKAVDRKHWEDRNGEHWLIVSENRSGMTMELGHVSNLYAACWQKEAGKWREIWEIKDFNQEIWESRSYVNNSLEVTDIDADGLAESIFMYELGHDGNDPTDFKLMLHVNAKKYAIRGTLASELEGIGSVEKMNVDPAFSEIAPEFKDYAIKKWKAFQTKWNQNLN